jgi:hypothetical protein
MKTINAYEIFVGKPDVKKPFGRLMHRWEDKVDLKETELEAVGWIVLAQDRNRWRALVSTVITSGFNERQGIYV